MIPSCVGQMISDALARRKRFFFEAEIEHQVGSTRCLKCGWQPSSFEVFLPGCCGFRGPPQLPFLQPASKLRPRQINGEALLDKKVLDSNGDEVVERAPELNG
jgi:hypothetical protein